MLIVLFNKILKTSSQLPQVNSDNDIPQAINEMLKLNKKLLTMPILLSVFALTLLALQLQLNAQVVTEKQIITTHLPPYFKQTNDLPFWQPKFHGAQQTTYIANRHEEPIFLIQASWQQQTQGQEIVSSDNRLVDEERWQVTNQRIKDIADNGVAVGKVNEYKITSLDDGNNYVLWSWYRINQQNTISDLKAKMYEFIGYIQGDNSGSIIALLAKNEASIPYMKSAYIYIKEK